MYASCWAQAWAQAGLAVLQLQHPEFKVLAQGRHVRKLRPGDLQLLLEVVARACKRISVAVGKGALGVGFAAPPHTFAA